ncbi:hypothetical protein ACTU4A_003061 [Listeria innocua]
MKQAVPNMILVWRCQLKESKVLACTVWRKFAEEESLSVLAKAGE